MSIETLYDRWKRLIKQEQTHIPPQARLNAELISTPSALLDTIRHIKTERPKHVWWYRWSLIQDIAHTVMSNVFNDSILLIDLVRDNKWTSGFLVFGAGGYWLFVAAMANRDIRWKYDRRSSLMSPYRVFQLPDECSNGLSDTLTFCVSRAYLQYKKDIQPWWSNALLTHQIAERYPVVMQEYTEENWRSLHEITDTHFRLAPEIDALRESLQTANIPVPYPPYTNSDIKHSTGILGEHRQNHIVASKIIEKAKQFGISLTLVGPVSDKTLTELQAYETFLDDLPTLSEQAQQFHQDIDWSREVHLNTIVSYRPEPNVEVGFTINWQREWRNIQRKVRVGAECQFIKTNIAPTLEWNDTLEKHCKAATLQFNSDFASIWNHGNLDFHTQALQNKPLAPFNVEHHLGLLYANRWRQRPIREPSVTELSSQSSTLEQGWRRRMLWNAPKSDQIGQAVVKYYAEQIRSVATKNNEDKADAISTIVQSFLNTKLTATQLQTLFELAINTANSISNDRYKAIALSNIATAQANAGLYELAINTANSIRYDDDKANAISNIATAQANADLIKEAIKTFELAINTANSIDGDHSKANALSNIATTQTNAGLINEAKNTFQQAINTANSIDDYHDKANAISNIATVQANAGLFEQAINTANSIDYDSEKFETLKNIIQSFSNKALTATQLQTLFELVINTANSIGDNDYKANALSNIAQALANTTLDSAQLQTLFELAINTANSISNDRYKANALSNIATTQTNAGLINEAKNTFQQAINTANSIDYDSYKDDAISNIAQALANSTLDSEQLQTLFEQTINIANSIDYDSGKFKTLSNIAQALANTTLDSAQLQTLFELVINTANSISDDRYKSNIISTIVQSFSNKALTATQLQTLFKLVINTAKSISDDRYKADAISTIVQSFLNTKLTATQLQTLIELAINTANSIRYDRYKAIALSNIVGIATTQTNAGLINEAKNTFQQAINTANSIDNYHDKLGVISNNSSDIAYTHNIQNALTLLQILTRFERRQETNDTLLSHIFTTLKSSQNIKEQKIFLQYLLEQEHAYSPTYLTLINPTSLFTMASTYTDLTSQSGLGHLALQLAKRGFIDESLTILETITIPDVKHSTILGVTQHFLLSNQTLTSDLIERWSIRTHTSSVQTDEQIWIALEKTWSSTNTEPFLYPLSQHRSDYIQMDTLIRNGLERLASDFYLTTNNPDHLLSSIHLDQNIHLNFIPKWTDEEDDLSATITTDSTFHTPLAWMLNPPKSQSTLPKEIVTLSKQLNLRTPPQCIRDGIDIGYTEGFIAYWTDALQRQVRAEELRDQYRKSTGDPFESIEKWYGVIESPDRSTDPCIQPFPFPLLTPEQLDALDDEINKVARDASKFKDLVRQANSLSIDTSDWGAPFQFDTWEAEIEMVSGLNTRMTDLIQRGQRMGLNLRDSLFKDLSVLAKPYTPEQTNHLQREIERIEGFIDDWNTAKRTAASVGYRFPSKPILSDITQENLDWHNLYIPQTKNVRTIMRRISFKSIPTGSVTPIGETEAIKITKGFSISTTEIPQELYCAVLGPTKSCKFQSGYPYTEYWQNTTEFIQALSHQMGLEGCESPVGCNTGYRLPTLDEWRYAALAKQRTFYAGSNIADEVAWTSQNSNEVLPSALKRPNAWGLYDMSGNVREWIDRFTCSGGSADSEARESSVMSTIDNSSPCGLRLVRP